MGIKVNHVGREKFKSIYELQLYEIISPSKTKYRLNDDEDRVNANIGRVGLYKMIPLG